MHDRTEIRDGKAFTVTALPDDPRLGKTATRKRATHADSMRRCTKCQRLTVPAHKKVDGKNWCDECKRRRREERGPTKVDPHYISFLRLNRKR